MIGVESKERRRKLRTMLMDTFKPGKAMELRNGVTVVCTDSPRRNFWQTQVDGEARDLVDAGAMKNMPKLSDYIAQFEKGEE